MQVLLGIYGSSKYESLAVEQFQLASERKKYHETIFLSFKELGNIKNQNALGRSLLLQTAQQLSGNSAVVYYTTSLFHTLGFTPKEALLYNAIASIPQILVLIPLVLSLDRRGRRPALLISQTGVVLSLSVLGAATLIKDDQARFWLLMLGIVMHRASFAAGLGPLPGVITPELMPFEIRSRGMSTSSSFNWLLNFGVTISFPIVFQKLGNSNYLVYWAFAFLSFIGLVMVFWWIPETTGIPLDEGVEPSASSKKTNISNDSMNADEQIPLDRISKTDINGNKSNNGSNNFKFQAELNSQFLDVWKPDANDLLGV